MWSAFFMAVVLGIVFVFAPGSLVLRGMGFSRVVSFSCAPAVSIAFYSLLAVVYGAVGVFCSWWVMFLPLAIVSLVVLLVGHLIRRGGATGLTRALGGLCDDSPRNWAMLGLYVGLGVVLCGFIFIKNLDGAESFSQEYDNVHHLSSIAAFVAYGDWSSLGATVYSEVHDGFAAPVSEGGFYPSGWHCVAAMLASALAIPSTVAANATNVLFVAFVFASSSFLLMRVLFPKRDDIVFFAGFCVFAFAAFPWRLMVWGPIFPNLASLCALPVTLLSFIAFMRVSGGCSERFVWAALFVVSLVSVVFLQPNSVFTAIVFLVPFAAKCFADFVCYYAPFEHRSRWRIVAYIAFGLLVCAMWYGFFRLPFLQNLVQFSWPSFDGFAQAAINVLLLSFRGTGAQFLLAFFVLTGVLYAFKHREYLWLVFSYAIMCAMYVVGAATDGFLKQFLIGFWYTDPVRIAANAALFAIPLASLGMCAVCKRLGSVVRGFFGLEANDRGRLLALQGLLAVVMLGVIVYPSYRVDGHGEVGTAFGKARLSVETCYSYGRGNVYDAAERQFVDDVVAVIPEGSVVLNEPNDGSAFAYSVDGLNVYYRYMNGYGGEDEAESSRVVRTSLDEFASSSEVRDAVEEIGADYVLQLDHDDENLESKYFFSYVPAEWAGIDSVGEDTLGFDLVLKRGDMRLYKISSN